MSDDKIIDSMIRINHAGELAAKRIYEGQLKFIKDAAAKAIIQDMAKGEEKHLEYFINEIRMRKTRPTLLTPFVDKIAYGLGAITGIMGKNTSMLCTAAVEDAIVEHYQEQLETLDDTHNELRSKIQQFAEDELEHKHIAESGDYRNIDYNSLMYRFINAGCRLAIRIVRYI